MNFIEDIRKHFGIILTDDQLLKFQIYFETLIEYNKHTNLTRITDKEEVYYKHFYDSLTLSSLIYNKDASLCDMGSGAGFPSIPLKIIYPELKITIIDSLNKRITFLKELTRKLEIDNINLIHSRIEDYGVKNNLKFDYVTARALGNLTLISEMALPMLKVKGRFLAMKGSNVADELKAATNTLKILNGKIINEMTLELPNDFGTRNIIIIEKEKHTKGYPRKYSLMTKNPL